MIVAVVVVVVAVVVVAVPPARTPSNVLPGSLSSSPRWALIPQQQLNGIS